MRALVVSDLHLDYAPLPASVVPHPDADVVIAAGDVCEGGARAMRWLRKIYPGSTPIVAVLGNHEFYGSSLPETREAARLAAEEVGVTLLDNSAAEIGGVWFVGGTLWTDYMLYSRRREAMRAAEAGMADHAHIWASQRPRRKFEATDALDEHNQTLAALTGMVGHVRDCVVVTHHLPHQRCVAPEYGDSVLNASFASDLSGLIFTLAPRLWVHGHTHTSRDFEVTHKSGGRTRILCNPRGYGGENPDFDPALLVDI